MKKILLFALLSTFSINAQTITDYVTGLGVPTGIAFDALGNLYVADNTAYTITKITPTLTKTTFATVNGTPQQIAFDSNYNLWSAGSGFFNRIAKITTAGAVTEYSASNSPYGIAINAADEIYYSEETGDIKKITSSGVISPFATGVSQPNGMTFDNAGNLIVVDKVEGEIKKITPAGVVSTLISGMANPTNVVYAPNGDLYISTGSQNRIFRFPAGSVDGDQYQYVRFNVNYDSAGHMAIYNGALYVSTGSSTHKIIKITDPNLGLEDNKNIKLNEVLIYPNPTTDYVYIKNVENVKTIQLFDISGKLVKTFNSSEIKEDKITLSNLNSGNYILKIDNVSKKIIIK